MTKNSVIETILTLETILLKPCLRENIPRCDLAIQTTVPLADPQVELQKLFSE